MRKLKLVSLLCAAALCAGAPLSALHAEAASGGQVSRQSFEENDMSVSKCYDEIPIDDEEQDDIETNDVFAPETDPEIVNSQVFTDCGVFVGFREDDRALYTDVETLESNRYPNDLIMSLFGEDKMICKAVSVKVLDENDSPAANADKLKIKIKCEYDNATVIAFKASDPDADKTETAVPVESVYDDRDKAYVFNTSDIMSFAVVVPRGVIPDNPYDYKVVYHFGPGSTTAFRLKSEACDWSESESWKSKGWTETNSLTSVLRNYDNKFGYAQLLTYPSAELENAEFLGWYIRTPIYDAKGNVVDFLTRRLYNQIEIVEDDFEKHVMRNDGTIETQYTANHRLDVFAMYAYRNSEGNIILDGNEGVVCGESTARLEWVPAAGSDSPVFFDAFEPYRPGYNFKGWNTRRDGSGETVSLGDIHTFDNGSITLYAQWEEREFTVKLVSDADFFGFEKDTDGSATSKTYKVKYFSKDNWSIELPAPSEKLPENVSFIGWFERTPPEEHWHDYFTKHADTVTAAELEDFTDDSITLYAQFKVSLDGRDNLDDTNVIYNEKGSPACTLASYLYLDANGGTIDGSSVHCYGVAGSSPNSKIPLDIPEYTPVREGYTFLGWNTEKDGSGEKCLTGGSGRYYANWHKTDKVITRIDLSVDVSSIKVGDAPLLNKIYTENYKTYASVTGNPGCVLFEPYEYWTEYDEEDGVHRYAATDEMIYIYEYCDIDEFIRDQDGDYTKNPDFEKEVFTAFDKKRYSYSIEMIYIEEGYIFAEDVKAYINGEEAVVEYAINSVQHVLAPNGDNLYFAGRIDIRSSNPILDLRDKTEGDKTEGDKTEGDKTDTPDTFNEPVWNWEGTDKAEATFVSVTDETKTKTIAAQITSEIVPASCESDGETVFTASVNFNGKTYSDKKSVTTPRTGHKYKLDHWNWDGCEKAYAAFVCESDAAHTLTVEAQISTENLPNGSTVYNASVLLDGHVYIDSATKQKDSVTAGRGDLDGDGEITSNDALTILRSSVGMEDFTPKQIKNADVDSDGVITANDALAVLRFSVGLGGENIGKPIS